MITYDLDEPELTATPAVQAVQPLHPTLEDELAELREVARRAQRREVEAVKNYDALSKSFETLSKMHVKLIDNYSRSLELRYNLEKQIMYPN